MRKDAKTRIRLRIQARLDDIGMTGRELARAVGHDDAWISGILKGSSGLTWKDFDAVADKLGLSPSELVRYDEAVMRELSPSEMRWLAHFQDWPRTIKDYALAMLDHFSGSMPDKDTAALLERLRGLPKSLRRPILSWLFRLLEEGIPPEAVTGGVVLGPNDVATWPSTTRPAGSPKTSPGIHKTNADRRVATTKGPRTTSKG